MSISPAEYFTPSTSPASSILSAGEQQVQSYPFLPLLPVTASPVYGLEDNSDSDGGREISSLRISSSVSAPQSADRVEPLWTPITNPMQPAAPRSPRMFRRNNVDRAFNATRKRNQKLPKLLVATFDLSSDTELNSPKSFAPINKFLPPMASTQIGPRMFAH